MDRHHHPPPWREQKGGPDCSRATGTAIIKPSERMPICCTNHCTRGSRTPSRNACHPQHHRKPSSLYDDDRGKDRIPNCNRPIRPQSIQKDRHHEEAKIANPLDMSGVREDLEASSSGERSTCILTPESHGGGVVGPHTSSYHFKGNGMQQAPKLSPLPLRLQHTFITRWSGNVEEAVP